MLKMKNTNLVEGEKIDERISNDELFNISSWGADLSFREILMMYAENDLLKPELQRNYVWSKLEASRFIDSILLGLPVPSIFLAKIENEQRLIIDGYQRIMTVHDFVNGMFSGDGKPFKLSNSDAINPRWRNKLFIELSDEEKRRIKATTIHAIIFEQKAPKNDGGMYQIFERINTGGKTLKAQEIRNCIYQGDMNELLIKLNKFGIWRSVLQSENIDSRMLDIELILRLFSMEKLYNNLPKQHSINLTMLMNIYMSERKVMDEQEKIQLEQKFEKIMLTVYELFGENVFRKPNNTKRRMKVNPVIFDAVAIATSKAIENGVEFPSKDEVSKRYTELFEDTDFLNMISKRTTNIENIVGRIDKVYKYVYGG